MMGWEPSKLGDVVHIKHGYGFKSQYFKDFGRRILLTPGNFVDEGGFKYASKTKYYEGPIPEGFILRKGDLITAMTEQAEGLLGSTAIVPHDDLFLHNQRLGLIEIKDDSPAHYGFLYYLFNTQYIRKQIRASANGAKVRHTSPERIYRCRFNRPPLPTQKKIAAILSAYDDLIENNNKRIALLERAAEEIYREWFVRMRFPGWETTKFEKGVPVGWEVKKMRQIVEFHIGGGWGQEKQSIDFSEGAYVIRGTDLPALNQGNLRNDVYRFHKASNLRSRRLKPGDIIFEVAGGSKNQLLGRSLMIVVFQLKINTWTIFS